MKRSFAPLLPILGFFVLVSTSIGQEPSKEKGGDKTTTKPDAAVIRKLVEQLGSTDFKTRAQAIQELSKLDEVPEALREAVKSADLETKRRAEALMGIITVRAEMGAFAGINEIGLDRFVRRMVSEEKFSSENQWKMVQAMARTVTKKANVQGARKYPVPDFDLKALPLADPGEDRVVFRDKRILVTGSKVPVVSVRGCVMLWTGPTPRISELVNSILIVDGDFAGAAGVENSLVIVNGKVGRITGVNKSIILATGEFEGAEECDDSFLQVNNSRILFASSRRNVLTKTIMEMRGDTTSHVLFTDDGPLQVVKFHDALKKKTLKE